MPIAISVSPSRHGRPKLSVMITGMLRPVSFLISRRRLAAERSGSSGSSSACPPPSTFETSTPLFAHRKPCCVSVIRTPFLRRMTARLSPRASSMTRASSPYCLAQATDSAEGVTLPRLMSRPSDLETILCLTIRMSRDCKRTRLRRKDWSSLSASESPGWISPVTAIGIRRSSARASPGLRSLFDPDRRIETGCHSRPGSTNAVASLSPRPPRMLRAVCVSAFVSRLGKLPSQPLRPRLARQRNQLLQVGRIVHINRDPRQFQHYARLARGLCRRMMRFEAVVAEAQREKIRWSPKGSISPASVTGGHEHTAFFGRVLHNFFQLPRLNQGNVGRNHQRALHAALHAHPSRHLDRAGFSRVLRIGDDFEPIPTRELHRVRIAGNHRNLRPVFPFIQSGKHIVQHGLSQPRARRLIENAGQPLLRRRQILDGNENHACLCRGWSYQGWSCQDWFSRRNPGPAAGSSWSMLPETHASTSRARAALSSGLRMMVWVHCTRRPFSRRASAARVSRTSQIRTSRKSS